MTRDGNETGGSPVWGGETTNRTLRHDSTPEARTMSTLRTRANDIQTAPDTESDDRARLLDLSFTQLAGGSLAAATAAFLGSRLGFAGTIAGAAIGSVSSAVAASLYTSSMQRARDVIRTARTTPVPIRSKSEDHSLGVGEDTLEWRGTLRGDETLVWSPDDTERPRSAANASRRMPLASRMTDVQPARAGLRTRSPRGPRSADNDGATQSTRRLRPTHVFAAAAVVFTFAAALLLTVQLATGTSVTGSQVGTRPSAGGAQVVPTVTPTPTSSEPSRVPVIPAPDPSPAAPATTPAATPAPVPAGASPSTPETTQTPGPGTTQTPGPSQTPAPSEPTPAG